MKRVLFVGFDPATVDYSDPAIPPGMTAERIHAGIKITLADMAKRGWDAELCLIRPDETAVAAVEGRLAAQRGPPRRAAGGHCFQHASGRQRCGSRAMDQGLMIKVRPSSVWPVRPRSLSRGARAAPPRHVGRASIPCHVRRPG